MISIHALREEGDDQLHMLEDAFTNFYPRPPRGGRQRYLVQLIFQREFLSTPSARRATHHLHHEALPPSDFYPRPPRGGRPAELVLHGGRRIFLSTPSARRATHGRRHADFSQTISIHALREEGDLANLGEQAVLNQISIHALREEGDSDYQTAEHLEQIFLSTPSARRATKQIVRAFFFLLISIHALREEGD